MINVLITGINSKIGNKIEWYLSDCTDTELFKVTKISLRGVSLDKLDMSGHDVVIHVAGISKTDTRTLSSYEEKEYYRVNAELTYNIAEVSKKQGVRQFIYLSTMMVYGNPAIVPDSFRITKDTVPAPQSIYGKSKLEGENRLRQLQGDGFAIAVIREPIVYGSDIEGEMLKLFYLSKHFFFFPRIENLKSYVHVLNICELIRIIISDSLSGVFCPQDKEILDFSHLYLEFARMNGRKCILIPGLTWILGLLSRISDPIKTICSDIHYCSDLTFVDGIDYQKYSIRDISL